ncbi:MAG: hypothetical protein EBY89_06690 [Actinobacteria bacterium]|nr:hypothetical protein [Actinomycetota bacterium]
MRCRRSKCRRRPSQDMSWSSPATRRSTRVDTDAARVVIGDESQLYCNSQFVERVTWAYGSDVKRLTTTPDVLVQSSAHGTPHPATLRIVEGRTVEVAWVDKQRRIAPGQSVVFYDVTNSFVLGGGIACAHSRF